MGEHHQARRGGCLKVVTTVHKAGYEQYGHRWFDGLENWPGADAAFYSEGFTPAAVDPILKRCEDLEQLCAFKAAHANYRPPSWRFDVVRFSNKVFAAYDALYNHDGIGVWLDCDVVTYKPIPPGYIEEQLGDAYIALFKRTGHYSETGLWLMNCAHPEHKEFMDTWLQWFKTGAFKQLPEWHDCTTLDATIRLFERDGRITSRSLSGPFEREMHPMAKADFGRYVDHTKGARKALGYSPENAHRKAA